MLVKPYCAVAALFTGVLLGSSGCVPAVTLRADKNEGSGGASTGGAAASGGAGGASPQNGGTAGKSAGGSGGAAGTDSGKDAASDAGQRDARAHDASAVPDATVVDVVSEPPVCGPASPDACLRPTCPGGGVYHGEFNRNSPTSTVIISVSLPFVQDILLGASIDGNAILVKRGCAGDGSMWLFDGDFKSGTYVGADISGEIFDLDFREESIALSPDGVTVVGSPTTARGFVIRRRANRQTTQFVQADMNAFVLVNRWVNASTSSVWQPRLSSDGLSFFFLAHPNGDPQPDGVPYEVTRTRPDDPFAEPDEPIPGIPPLWGGLTGVSADRLTAYVHSMQAWATSVYVRPFIGAPFQEVLPPISGIRTMPIDDDCGSVIGNGTTAGCAAEEIYVSAR